MQSTVSFSAGQAVHWPPAPEQLAQIEDLMRTRIRLVYRTKTGRWRRPVVSARRLHELNTATGQPPLPLTNPFGRGVRPRTKPFPGLGL